MTHEYPRGLRGPVAQDVALAVLWLAFLVLVHVPGGGARAHALRDSGRARVGAGDACTSRPRW